MSQYRKDLDRTDPEQIALEQTIVPEETLEVVGIRAGMILQGKYRIESLLSRGGMGAVYEGTDLTLERQVAIKFLAEQFKSDGELVFRFHREARVIAGLDHPNIVPVYAVGEQEGQHYFVMKLVEGLTIKQMIQQQGALNISIAADIIRQVCDGLEHIHGKGFAHRDIKSQNIIIDLQGRAIILDFGIIRQMDGANLTRTGVSTGTPEYIAPEQAREAKRADERSDIYSLGITFYEMLVGRTPFKASSAMDLIIMHINQPPEPPSAGRPDLPRAVDDIVVRMLAKNPDDRYQTVVEVRNALAAAVQPVMTASQSDIVYGQTEGFQGPTHSHLSPAREAAIGGALSVSPSSTSMYGESVPRTVAPPRRHRFLLPLSLLIAVSLFLGIYFSLKKPPNGEPTRGRARLVAGHESIISRERAELLAKERAALAKEAARRLVSKKAKEAARKLVAPKARKLAATKARKPAAPKARKLAATKARKLAATKARKLDTTRALWRAADEVIYRAHLEKSRRIVDRFRKLGPTNWSVANKKKAQTVGQVMFSSTPKGAVVFGDGKRLGRTPVTKKLSKGEITIKMVLENHEPWQKKHLVVASRMTKIKAYLKPLPGKLGVIALYNGEPVMGARVYLNRWRLLGKTPLMGTKLKPGRYAISVEEKGLKPFACPAIVIKPGKLTKCTATLSK